MVLLFFLVLGLKREGVECKVGLQSQDLLVTLLLHGLLLNDVAVSVELFALFIVGDLKLGLAGGFGVNEFGWVDGTDLVC